MPKIITDDTSGSVSVIDSSPKHHRNAVERVARYFGRETENPTLYNSAQPSGGTYEPYVETKAFIFTHQNLMHYTKSGKCKYATKGACCFRRRTYTNINNPPWQLDWIWIHPFYRNKGILSFYWDFWIMEFGNFFPTAPLSKAMKRFLDKIEYSYNPSDYFYPTDRE